MDLQKMFGVCVTKFLFSYLKGSTCENVVVWCKMMQGCMMQTEHQMAEHACSYPFLFDLICFKKRFRILSSLLNLSAPISWSFLRTFSGSSLLNSIYTTCLFQRWYDLLKIILISNLSLYEESWSYLLTTLHWPLDKNNYSFCFSIVLPAAVSHSLRSEYDPPRHM